MATSQTEIRSPAVELSPEALKVFCESIAGVFGVNIQCNPQQAVAATVSDLEQCFGKLVAVDCVRAEGVIEGTLQFVLDKVGMFTLAGILLGMPEEDILEYTEHGSLADGEDLSDAIREIGHLLAGAWQKAFNEEFDDPSHFAKISTFIGDPWDNAEERTDLPANENLLLVRCEITIEPYPAFECGVIIPEAVFAGAAVWPGEEAAAADQEAEEETDEAEGQVEAASEEDAEELAEGQIEAESEEDTEEAEGQVESGSEEDAEEDAEGQVEAGSGEDTEEVAEKQAEAGSEEEAEDVTEEGLETETEEESGDADEGAVSEELEVSAEAEDAAPDVETGGEVSEEEAAAYDQGEESSEGGVSESIQKMTQSSAVLPGQSAQLSLAMPVQEIMQKEVVWGGPDDSVQQAFTKMQHHDVGYIMIGEGGVLEGIVSQSDLTGAISPYLRPIFSKWRRPSDDATLQIKIKWIMSRLVRTIGPQASVAAAIESMCRSGGGCLPVVDQQGQVLGLVTAFDIFKVLSAPGVSSTDESSALRTSA